MKYIDFPFVPGADGTKILIPKEDLMPKFAFYQLQSIDLRARGYARHFSELRKSKVWVPSSEEQEAVIGLIEDFYSRLRTAEEEAEKVMSNLTLLRRSLLHQSFFRQREGD